MDALDRLTPAVAVGQRVSLRVRDRELIGFVTRLAPDAVGVLDRRGSEHVVARGDVAAARRVGVSLGRDPLATPRPLLDALAARAGAAGEPWVCRISALLADRTPPASVAPWGECASFDGVSARFEGEWVTLGAAPVDVVVAAAWWATRMGARSVQVRCDDASVTGPLAEVGFARHA